MTPAERARFEQALADEFGNPIDRLKLEPYEYNRLVKAGAKAIAQAVQEERERLAKCTHQCLMEACCLENALRRVPEARS